MKQGAAPQREPRVDILWLPTFDRVDDTDCAELRNLQAAPCSPAPNSDGSGRTRRTRSCPSRLAPPDPRRAMADMISGAVRLPPGIDARLAAERRLERDVLRAGRRTRAPPTTAPRQRCWHPHRRRDRVGFHSCVVEAAVLKALRSIRWCITQASPPRRPQSLSPAPRLSSEKPTILF